MDNAKDAASISRRRLLQAAALAVPAVGVMGCTGSHRDAETSQAVRSLNPDLIETRGGLAAEVPIEALFLTDAERRFLDAAVDRLIPGDENSPGALLAGVTTFVDRQLTGPYGQAQTWYMHGPWSKGTKQQGYQSKLTPAQMYRAAIHDIDAYCQKKYQKRFDQLPGASQDEVLHGLENGDIDLADAPAKDFFDLLLQNTQEGYLADPMYGGNRGFAGWNLIGFPGPRYNYVEEIEQYGKRYTLPTVGLLGRGDARKRGG
ncbi:MAG: gluconate 2-dehydrogenase subunit 3 family protein [Rhodanobacteraceae bacterium]